MKPWRWSGPSLVPTYSSVTHRPYERDICRMSADATRRYGLKLGWYYSTCDWTHPAYLQGDNHLYNQYYHAQVREPLTDYGCA